MTRLLQQQTQQRPGNRCPVRPIGVACTAERLQAAEERGDDEGARGNGLSHEAMGRRERGEARDGAGGWYNREPIAARQTLEDASVQAEGTAADRTNRSAIAGGTAAEPDVEDDEADEEGRRPKMLGSPVSMSRQMREEHEVTHLPYRSWCAHCVSGRGISTGHRRKKEHDREVETPRIAMDYFYLTGDQEEEKMPCIIMVNEETGERYSRMVEKKGVGPEIEWTLKDMIEELKTWGHHGGVQGKIILKTDGEAAIMALRDQLAKMLGTQAIVETSAREQHESNGTAEESVRAVRGMVITLKSQIEEHTGLKLLGCHCITQWMLRWAAMLLSRFQVGKDGRTGYERRRGRSCTVPAVCFGEKVWYKEGRRREARPKLESEWSKGVWLGHARSSNEMWIGTGQGAVKVYDVKRLPQEERWDKEIIRNLKGTPQRPNHIMDGEDAVEEMAKPEDKEEQHIDGEEKDQEDAARPRRTMITDRELQKFGYTMGCPGCASRKQGKAAKKGHSEACRRRIEAEMEKTDEGKRRLDDAKARMTQAIARDLER